MYLLAIFLPPVAVLAAGKPGQALLNLVLTLCFWFPGMIHALMVVSSHQADGRNNQLMKQSERQHQQTLQLMHRQAEIEAVKAGLAPPPPPQPYVEPRPEAESWTGPSYTTTMAIVAGSILLLCMMAAFALA